MAPLTHPNGTSNTSKHFEKPKGLRTFRIKFFGFVCWNQGSVGQNGRPMDGDVQGRGRQFLIDGMDEDGRGRPNLENLTDVPDGKIYAQCKNNWTGGVLL